MLLYSYKRIRCEREMHYTKTKDTEGERAKLSSPPLIHLGTPSLVKCIFAGKTYAATLI